MGVVAKVLRLKPELKGHAAHCALHRRVALGRVMALLNEVFRRSFGRLGMAG
jgi:hypothetical protein